jgi:hypothetical protein
MNCKSDDQEAITGHELTDVLNAHGSYWQHMGAPFQYNPERRPLFKQQLRIVFLQRGLHYRPLLY